MRHCARLDPAACAGARGVRAEYGAAAGVGARPARLVLPLVKAHACAAANGAASSEPAAGGGATTHDQAVRR